MLVLTRRPDERIVFPELGISIRVMRTKGNQVRLGIEAPKDVRVLRGELAFEFESQVPIVPQPNCPLPVEISQV